MAKGSNWVIIVFSRQIKIVEHFGNQNIRIGVESIRELITLIVEVALYLKFDWIVIFLNKITDAQLAAKFLPHQLVRQISDMANHTS